MHPMTKNFTLFILALFFIPAAYTQSNRFNRDFLLNAKANDHTLADIPLVAHNRKVDIFFNNEKPSQDYYKVKVIDLTSNASNSYNNLLAGLQEKARLEGLDGLMILDIRQWPVYSGARTVAGATINNAQALYAVGLKYRANLQYVDTIMKTAVIKTFSDKEAKENYQVNFTMSGLLADSVPRKADDYYLRNIAVFNKADYFITHQPVSPAEIFFDRDVKWMETDTGDIKYKALYTGSVLQSVEIRLPGDANGAFGKTIYHVQYQLDDTGRLVERMITVGRKKLPLYKDKLEYDNRKRLIKLVRHDATSNEIIMQVSYDFYTMNDLPPTDNATIGKPGAFQ